MAIAVVLTMLSGAKAMAQDAPIQLPQVQISSQPGEGLVDSRQGTVAANEQKRDPKDSPVGEVKTTIDRAVIEDTPAQSVADVLSDSPGVTFKQGSGPRDVIISIRGNNNREIMGIRNTEVYEDGFPVTQPGGFSRFDLTDPHAYGSIDVLRGPQSALFGNYASGGAILFHTVPGGALNGVEYGFDGGTYGYLSNWARFGEKSGPFEASLFVSDARGEGFITQNGFNTQTINFLGTWTPTPDNRVVVKAINNQIYDQQPIRQSLDQFLMNPLQRGCLTAATAAPGCATLNVLANGFYGPTVPITAQQADLFRDDRRTILGVRYEHDFDSATTGRIQFTYDDRVLFEPSTTPVSTGDFPAFDIFGDLTKRGEVMGLPTTAYVAFLYDTMTFDSPSYFLTPYGTPGAVFFQQKATQANLGGRVRAEVSLAPQWFGVIGASVENTTLKGLDQTYTYSSTGTTVAPSAANRTFLNGAPEVSLAYRPNGEWQFRGRVATGYTTPVIGDLFVTPQGTAGTNTQLKTQQNLGFDLGADWTPLGHVTLSTTGFYEFFHNELVQQSPGAGLLNYTFNAPASEHRGVELLAKADLPSGLNGFVAYTFDNQIYTDYVEQLSAGHITAQFSRDGNRIPGLAQNALTARLGYDVPGGPLKGLGAFVETVMQSSAYLDNANLVSAGAFEIWNVNLHFNRDVANSALKKVSLYLEARNLFDERYIGSSLVVADSIDPTTGRQNSAATVAAATGSIYAGAPRSFFGGLRLTF